MPSQTLSLSQSQHLQMVLAPQLRQSLEMLQVPMLELRAMIQQEIQQNPTIEEVLIETPTVEIEPGSTEAEDTRELEFDKEFEMLARLDEEWRDYFFQNLQNRPYTQDDDEKRQFLMDSLPQRESLQEHLLNQLNLAGLAERDRQTGELLLGSTDDDGYLTVGLEELAESANMEVEHLESVLAVVQDFHPTGICSRDLQECLLTQLDRLGKRDSMSALIVSDYLKKLGGKKYNDIARSLKVTVEEVHAAVKLIATLDPKPGRLFTSDIPSYVLPEIFVNKVEGKWVIVMNDDQLPHVRISKHYRTLLSSETTTNDVKSYVRERIRSGAFLIKSIHQRQKTIFRIATEIVERQTEFLEHGISQLKPLTMSVVSEAVGVHETTVSRAVSGKYMQTPKGIFELKYFFTPGIKTADGTEVSNKTVKEMINQLVAMEDEVKPLSDQEIVKLLTEKGIKIARRTVAKYRLVLRIPPSHMRRTY